MGKALVTQVWGPESQSQTHAKLQSQCSCAVRAETGERLTGQPVHRTLANKMQGEH